MTRYWWSKGADQNRGIHWLGWHRMAKHRLDDGLGFKSLNEFNLAMLGKQGWNIITRPHSLVTRVLKTRYFPTTSFFETSLGHNPSFFWRSILAFRNLVKAGAYWRIGNGRSVSIWSHPWLKKALDSLVSTPPPPNCTLSVVADLMISHRWNESLIAQLFNDRDRSCILNISLSLSSHPDVCCWLSLPFGWPAFSAASLREWFSLAFITASTENASLILMIYWALWHNRNNVVWKAQGRTASGGWIKVNIDASLNSQRSSLGFGCVVRDANGRFMVAKAGCFYSQMEVKCAETIAFREALSWIKECGCDRVLFESDAQILVVSINNVSLDNLSPFGLLVQDCKLLLSSYEEARYGFIHRSANNVAYVLITSAHSESGQGVWVNIPPPHIVSLIVLS
ncbi:uncharacterized protein LOC122723637 [Manihot esculenta]|uniref:uncharacterized protein LOC122723637 n=1 Tax=Manihot esculenta TaxID=3983 RepID=UPI001CC81BDB|nr:uncharacterized protein LOC122723637 [Manihot esculenta]